MNPAAFDPICPLTGSLGVSNINTHPPPENTAVSAVLVSTLRTSEEPSLDTLLANAIRDAGWIMAGGSAQFRQGALSELQASLRQVLQRVANERVIRAAKLLGEKAVQVATRNLNDAESVMGLGRMLGEFEAAMKPCVAAARKR